MEEEEARRWSSSVPAQRRQLGGGHAWLSTSAITAVGACTASDSGTTDYCVELHNPLVESISSDHGHPNNGQNHQISHEDRQLGGPGDGPGTHGIYRGLDGG